jgi:hypothetical protein
MVQAVRGLKRDFIRTGGGSWKPGANEKTGAKRDAANAVLEQPESLRMAVPEGPQDAQGVTRFKQFKQLADSSIFFGTHGGHLLVTFSSQLIGKHGLEPEYSGNSVLLLVL